MTERSDRIFELGREAGEKYDYFMAGLAAALTAFIAESFNPSSLGAATDVTEAVAILVLAASVAAGVKRIAVSNHLLRVAQSKIDHVDRIEVLRKARQGGVVHVPGMGDLAPHQVEDLLATSEKLRGESHQLERKLAKRGIRAAQLRDGLLVTGFVLLVAARLLRVMA